MMIGNLIINLLTLGLFIFIVRKFFTRGRNQGAKGGEVRRFFQYGLMLALTIISSIGISGLVGRILHIGTMIYSDRGSLALDSSFTLVGTPLLIVFVMWTRNTMRKDPSEVMSLGWNFYLTGASIVALILNLNAQMKLYGVIIHENPLQGKDIAQFLVWGVVWLVHFRLHNKHGHDENTIGHHLIGSVIGLGYSAVGLITIFEALLKSLFPAEANSTLINSGNTLQNGLVTLLIGAPVWYLYWVRTAAKATKESIWYAYVLLIGVGGGVLTSVIASSFTLYSVLVWFFGDTRSASAAEHFHDAPASLAAAIVGLIVIWYHRDVLAATQTTTRTEIRRVYEYVIAGIGLLAAVGGIIMILVSIVESVTKTNQISGPESTNTLVVAITLITVGGPVWAVMWKLIQNKIRKDPQSEQSSFVRRFYLFTLFGVSGVAALISLLAFTYMAFDDLFKGEIGEYTIHDARFPIGILIATIFVSIYHWIVYRAERHVEIQRAADKDIISKLYFFVEMKLVPEHSEKLIDVLYKYAVHVRKERGCEQIDVLREADNENIVYLYEIWSDEKTHQAHLTSEGFKGWKEYSDPLIASFKVKNLSSTR